MIEEVLASSTSWSGPRPTRSAPRSACGGTPASATGSRPAKDHAEIPFLLGFDPVSAPEGAADAVARCAYGPSYTGWRQHTAQELSAWSVHTPRTADPLEVDAVLQITEPEADVVETLCRLFGMAVPVERELDDADQAAIVRAQLASAAERKRKRRSFETAW